ncbi:MAG: YhbY family RNA-binding protein [Bacteroides sp.]|nr:YhbY family RNA-binding protein [Bacteroides sp.]
MTSKERARLKSIAANTDAILQIGKNPIGDAFLKQVADALQAREMIKIHVLETCELTAHEAANALAEAADCEVVQVIGSKAVLFKRRKKGDKRGSYLDGNGKSPESENAAKGNGGGSKAGKACRKEKGSKAKKTAGSAFAAKQSRKKGRRK